MADITMHDGVREMKVKIGDTVSSEFGDGVVVAMSKQWCIYSDSRGEEYAVVWNDVFVPVEAPDVPESKMSEMNL